MCIRDSPSLTPQDIEDVLKDTARPFIGNCDGCGSGLVDAHAALLAVTDGEPTNPTDPTDPTDPVDPDPIVETVTYGGATNVTLNDASRYWWFFTREGVSRISLNVGNSGENGQANVVINHNNHNELSVTLTAPDGTQTAMSRTSVAGTAGQYAATTNGNNGIYTLTVVDRTAGNRGSLNYFAVTQDEVQ